MNDNSICENFSRMFCSCGGAIVLKHHEENFSCDKCGKIYPRKSIRYSSILYNNETGVRYPVKKKTRGIKGGK